MRAIALILLRGYRLFLSPLKTMLFGPGACCRHVPSCSAYAEEAVRQHGTLRGLWLTLCRVGRCHPWGTAGWDPVPSSFRDLPCNSSSLVSNSGPLAE